MSRGFSSRVLTKNASAEFSVSFRHTVPFLGFAVWFILFLWSIPAVWAGSPERPGPRPELETIVADAMASPEVEAARARWEAAQERSTIARAWPDPMVMYGYFGRNVETRIGAQIQRVSLSQRIPYPGKLSDAGDIAAQEALLAMWRYRARVSDVVHRAKSLYFELYEVDTSRTVLGEQERLLEQISRTAQGTFEAGATELSDVLKVRLAKDEIRTRLIALTQRRTGLVARLNALLARDRGIPVPEVRDGTSLPQLPPEEQLYSLANAYRQELQQAAVAVTRDELGLSLAQKERLPDFTVGLDYTQVNPNIFSNPPDNGRDALMLSVSVNLPIWLEKLRAKERMARKELVASRETLAGVQLQVEADVRDAWSQAKSYREQVELYRDTLIPQAEDAFRAAEASYSGGEGSLIDLLDSERSLLALRLGLIMNEAQLGQALATLERSVGVDLSRLQQFLIPSDFHAKTNN